MLTFSKDNTFGDILHHLAEILRQIDRLPLNEQTKILRQLEQKIETATAYSAAIPTPANISQQQW